MIMKQFQIDRPIFVVIVIINDFESKHDSKVNSLLVFYNAENEDKNKNISWNIEKVEKLIEEFEYNYGQ